jgi:hypothetical protein
MSKYHLPGESRWERIKLKHIKRLRNALGKPAVEKSCEQKDIMGTSAGENPVAL